MIPLDQPAGSGDPPGQPAFIVILSLCFALQVVPFSAEVLTSRLPCLGIIRSHEATICRLASRVTEKVEGRTTVTL